MKISGPYTRKDGRQIISIRVNGRKTSKSYPKYLMEQFLGRDLLEDETVHHIDGNPLNNEFSNLKILDRAEHSKQDAKKVKSIIITCVLCGNKAEKNARYLTGNSKKGKAGPFCSRSCAGKYGKAVQMGMDKMDVQPKVEVKDRKYYK